MQCRQLQPRERTYAAERRAFKQLVLRTARHLAQGDSEVATVLDFVVPRLALRQPLPQYQVSYFDKPSGMCQEDMLLLAPVRAADSWLLEADAPAQQFSGAYHAETVYGAYYRGTRTIYMPMDWQLSPEVCALIFLHESTHAFDHLSRRRPLTRWRSELRARQLEYRLLVKLYPVLAAPPGQLPLEDVVANLAATGTHLGQWEPSPALLSHAALDDLFGTALSASDRHYYRGALGKAMVQRYLLAHGGSAAMKKQAVLD